MSIREQVLGLMPEPVPSRAEDPAAETLRAARQILVAALATLESVELMLNRTESSYNLTPGKSTKSENLPESVPSRAESSDPDACLHAHTQRLEAMGGATVFLCSDCGEQVDP